MAARGQKSFKEISRAMGIPHSTVWYLYCSAMRKLRQSRELLEQWQTLNDLERQHAVSATINYSNLPRESCTE